MPPARSSSITTDMPGIARDEAQKPIVSADYIAYTLVSKKSDGLDTGVLQIVKSQFLSMKPSLPLASWVPGAGPVDSTSPFPPL